MRKISIWMMLVCLLALAARLAAQQGKAPAQAPAAAASASQEVLRMWNATGQKVIAVAEDFPEDKYDFKVQKDQRSFAENLLHIAGTDYVLMSAVKGSQMGPGGGENPPRSEYRTKADVVKLVKQAVADGAALIKEQGDAGLGQVVKYPYANMMVHADFNWLDAIEHTGEHYGQLVVYYRANNMVPPASRPQPSVDKSQRPSPPAHADCKFADGKTITVDYSSPRMRGRKIYGGLVPYGKVWRAGANEATAFVISTDLTVGGKTVPAGSYTIFTIPNADSWTLIISKKTGEWGIPYPGEADDFARVDMKVSKLPSPVEDFTISFHQSGSACTMSLDWEATRASVDIAEKK
jgi:hypothetical protein